MTNTDPIKALVDLGPELRRGLTEFPIADHGCIVPKRLLQSVLSAIEALTPIAEGTQGRDCKMAWKQGFCYGDPEYYPAPSASTGKDGVVERVAKALENVLLDIDFTIERGLLPDIRNDMIYVEARAALAAIGER